jgi:transcription-repair coupling factor (superfamily II helicase)
VARFRARARQAGLTDVTAQGTYVRFAPVELPESGVLRLNRLHPRSIVKPALRTMLVPRPTTAVVGGRPIRDEALLSWAREVVDTVVDRIGERVV